MYTINHKALSELIKQNDWWFTASELHGILSALAAFNLSEQWPSIINDTFDPPYDTLIPELSTRINNDLANSDLNYQLLLPEEENITITAQAMSFWAQGFYIAHQFLKENKQLFKVDKTSEDFLNDVNAITQLDWQIENTNENDQLLNQLEEHLRMGTLLIYAQTHHKT